MREVTVLIPEARIPEFYQRFGDFMSEQATTSVLATPTRDANGDRIPDWANGPGAPELVRDYWNALSSDGQTALGILIDGAMRERREKFTPQDLIDELHHPKGASGIAGVFGAAGRAAKKVGIPRYRYSDTNSQSWHFIWDWDGERYWMSRQVAELFREAMSR